MKHQEPPVRAKSRSASVDLLPLFEKFWKAYPKKVAKDAARKAFEKRKPDQTLLDKMIGAVQVQTTSEQWQKDKGQFIPNPATWLNQGRWEDEAVGQANSDKLAWEGAR
ncbi:hypothetical protein [Rhodoferax sp. GW822-FHT02A01]|uniref:hypothetical protein n=1 Tax=Rhodoferax sp. GW822-FHT02A01 TaxID=3141537 RepID=UPI00315CE211